MSASIIAVISGYLLGSVPFAYLLARRHRGFDLRRAGSGNVGAANLLRTTTVKIGIGAMALDMAKGVLSVILARQLEPGSGAPAAAGIAAVLGHIYPVWLKFRGGKGVATSCGVFAVLAPWATVMASLLFLVTVWWTKYVSLGSVIASALLGPLAYLTGSPFVTVLGAIIVGGLIVQRHRSNLARIMAGSERRIGQRV